MEESVRENLKRKTIEGIKKAIGLQKDGSINVPELPEARKKRIEKFQSKLMEIYDKEDIKNPEVSKKISNLRAIIQKLSDPLNKELN